MRASFLFLSFFLSSLHVHSWDISLILEREVSGAVGGEAFLVQPELSVSNKKKTNFYTNIEGQIRAKLVHAMVEEKLGVISNGRCETDDSENGVSFPIKGGVTKFSDLCINRSGDGYIIDFELFDEFGILLGSTKQVDINVQKGNPYQIGVIQAPRVVFGGKAWLVSPIVAIQDRGRNKIDNINDGNISISLVGVSNGGRLSFPGIYDDEGNIRQNASPNTMRWSNGTAEFEGLSIDVAQEGYQLNFSTSIALSGPSFCLSDPISVQAGEAEGLVEIEGPHMGPVYGGKVFVHQPVLHLVDAGGNIATNDNASLVSISLYEHLSNASIFPIDKTAVTSEAGVVRFRNLFINPSGNGYRFIYELFSLMDDGSYIRTNITHLGTYFNVNVGSIEALKVLRQPSDTWAGNQPFEVQPKLAVVDAGGNVIENFFNGTVDAFVVKSLSQTSEIRVDTQNDAVPSIKTVYFHESLLTDNKTLYSSGHTINIVVTFTDEIFLRTHFNQSLDGLIRPALYLNVINSHGETSKAILSDDMMLNVPTKQLLFTYFVDVNEDIAFVDIKDNSSLLPNNYIIQDIWGRNASLILPDPNSNKTLFHSKKIGFHNQRASIKSIKILADDEEHGSGKFIDFEVAFTHEVAVVGIPELQLNISSLAAFINTEQLGTTLSKSYFYIWYNGERSESISWDASSEQMKEAIETISSITGSVCVSRSKVSQNTNSRTGFKWVIRFESIYDDLRKGFHVETPTVTYNHTSTLITTSLKEITDETFFWHDDTETEISCSYRCAKYISGTGSKTLIFRYRVLPGDRAHYLSLVHDPFQRSAAKGGLVVNSLNDGSTSSILANLTMHRNLILPNHSIRIDTEPPKIMDLTVTTERSLESVQYAGDELLIEIVFNKALSVKGQPYIFLNVRQGVGKATYLYHNANKLVFSYRVQKDHWSLSLFNTSESMNIETRNESYVRHLSDVSVTDADLVIPWSLLIPFNNTPVKVDGRVPTVTKISILDDEKKVHLHSGGLIPIQVCFTAPVMIFYGPPVIVVSLGGRFSEAKYHSGNGTSILTFAYKVRTGDTSSAQFYCHYICVAAGCLEGVSVEGYVMLMSSNPILHSPLMLPLRNEDSNLALFHSYVINTTLAPYPEIKSLEIDDTAQVVSFGDIVRFYLYFSDEVYIYGNSLPLIDLNIASNAVYERGNGTVILIFRLLVTEYDEIDRLDWIILPHRTTPIICDDQAIQPCQIRNANGDPANLSFINRNGNTEIQPLQQRISINGTKPSILSAHLESKSCESQKHDHICIITAGDSIQVHFEYTLPVLVRGTPFVQLSLVDRKGNHVNAMYAKHLSNSTALVFTYEIDIGDYTQDDKNVSINSPNIQCSGRMNCITRKTSLSTLLANTVIPIERNVRQNRQNISVDATSIPKVQKVHTLNSTGVYSPGDRLVIVVVFDYSVVVVGTPVIGLDVGSGILGFASFFDNTRGIPSSDMYFEFHVKKNYCTSMLEYIDRHSLVTDDSTIKKSSANPKISASTILPDPRSTESLSGHQRIILDCRVPYISNIWSPIAPANVCGGETVPILVKFSRPVQVTGIPRLKLETGVIDRFAIYKYMIDDSTLLFEYFIMLGDFSESLDYWTQEGTSRSSNSSFDLTNGTIMLVASNPLIDADVHLNPSRGNLVGNKKKRIIEGEVEYFDLQIDKAGADYKLRFSLSISDQRRFEISTDLTVTESSEFQLALDASDRNYGDMFGYSTSIHGNLIAIGAPKKRISSPEIQVLTVKSGTDSDHHEVQVFGTSLNVTEALKQVRSFRTFCDNNKKIEGSFDLRYINDDHYVHGTLRIPVDADSFYLRNILTDYLPMLGQVQVSRTQNNKCNCSNAWEWTITCIGSSLPLNLFVFDSGELEGDSAGISEVEYAKNLSLLEGGFTLENPITKKQTRLIPYNASASYFHTAIEEDFGIDVHHVKVYNEHGENHPSYGRRWEVTFSHFSNTLGTDNNIPNMNIRYGNLTGSHSYAWSHIAYEGRSTISGSFAVSLSGSEFSHFIPYNASEQELKNALESLDSINHVIVSDRSTLENIGGVSGCSWTITFLSVNVKTEYGWLLDPGATSRSGNLPPLSVKSHLIGWNTAIEVENESGTGKNDTQAQWMKKTKGDDGIGRGMVGIYSYSSGAWKFESYVSASDGDSHDNFGHSVSVEDGIVAVGAPSKEVNGILEKQILTCTGENIDGSFRISFRGGVSDPIPFNASVSEIKYAMEGIYGRTKKIHSMPRITIQPIDDWNELNSGFCSHNGNSLMITLLTPDGGGNSTDLNKSDGDVEDMVVDSSNLNGGSIRVYTTRNGTRTLSGEEAVGAQAGAVYIYNRSKDCRFCLLKWTEIVKLTSLDADTKPHGSDQFGWSVAIKGNILFVGAPGSNNQEGKVYVFTRYEDIWIYSESLKPSAYDINMESSMFGRTISFDGDTVIIGAPGYDNSRGCAVVFKKTKSGFLASQIILSPILSSNQEFGHSISLFKDSTVICSPSSSKRTGLCHIFERKSKWYNFELVQKLIPSNVKIGDRFGWSVSMWENRIVVGQVEDYTGNITVMSPIQVVTTQSDCEYEDGALGFNFKLKWLEHATYTRELSHSISAKGLKDALEEDLNTGTVHVTRTQQPDKCGGFTWKVTFLSMERFKDPMLNVVPTLFCDATYLTGRNATCTVTIENTMSNHIRAKAHLFTQKNQRWVEQAFLFPYRPQPQDLTGSAVSIYQDTAVLGAPNRNSLNINSGAAFIHDVSFSDAYFEKPTYRVKEGDVACITIKREINDKELILGYQSMDINSPSEYQEYVRVLYSFDYPRNTRMTAIQRLTGHTAFARIRENDRIDKHSNWIHGLFDYRGLRDYDSINKFHLLDSKIVSHQIEIITHSDSVFENPSETFSLQISLPGMFASPLGSLKVDIEIEDNEEGLIGDSIYYTKFVQNIEKYSQGRSFNTPVHVLNYTSVAIVGDPIYSCSGSTDSKYANCGRAFLFRRIEKKWTLLTEIINPQEQQNSLFGTTVALTQRGNEEITILVGCPGQVALYVFILHLSDNFIEFKDRLEPFGEFKLTPEHDFATMNTVTMNSDVICAAAPQLEIVFVYRWSKTLWIPWITLRARDFDYDIYDMNYTVHHLHRQRFGHAIKTYARFLVVSAPYADYGNRGSIFQRERYNTDGLDNAGLGTGKVYVFYSRPHITNILWSFHDEPLHGSFKLRYLSNMLETNPISITCDTKKIQNEIQSLGLEVTVGKTLYKREDLHFISIKITFVESYSDDAPNLQVQWSKSSCQECDTFSNENHNEINATLQIIKESIMAPYQQTSELESSDVMSGDGFGFSVDIDKNNIIIGAPFSSANTRTTWDFETGDLTGWVSSGTAFHHQPTYGDNSIKRHVYSGIGRPSSRTSGDPQSAGIQGRYYIATYERRRTQYDKGGSLQGDIPVGTLTSDPFIIEDGFISFLIGGGCNHLTVYIELLVDGISVMRSTGSCHERMERLEWNVSAQKNRSAQIRIVDNDQGHWGHINIDDIQFSWINENSVHYNSAQVSPSAFTRTERKSSTTSEKTSKAGAAYVFQHQCNQLDCGWKEIQRLVPSDKRKGNLFGSTVAINSDLGIILVGSPSAAAHGIYREEQSPYPFNDAIFTFPMDSKLENFMKDDQTQAPNGGSLRLLDHVRQDVIHKLALLPESFGDNAGAVYMYTHREDNSKWMISEDVKFSPPNIGEGQRFGGSISLSGSTALFGTVSESKDAFLFDLKWYGVRFKQNEFIAREDAGEINIEVVRDKGFYLGEVSIGYSTSDLTALGVTKDHFEKCLLLSLRNRTGCGDYEQAFGFVTFGNNQSSTSFQIRIMNDAFRERNMKYVHLSMHIPGGSVLHGEGFRAQLRIDDDDFTPSM